MKSNSSHKKAFIKAVAYCRFSSEMQHEDSINAQLVAINEYASRKNLILVEEFIDRAKSATTDQRPEFLRMINSAKKKEFNVIIVHKRDRIFRNRSDAAIYKHLLKQHGVNIESVTEPLDNGPESIILESVLDGMAEYYSKNLARETMKGLMQKARNGQATGGPPPFGFRINPDTKKLELNEIESEGVRLIFKMILEGHSYKDVIHELNDRGFKTRGGKAFGINSLYSLLRNEKYRGCYTFNKAERKDKRGTPGARKYKSDDEIVRVENGCPRIVSDEVFFAVQRKMNTRQQPTDHAIYKETYQLTGKIFCGLCGNTYVGSRRKKGGKNAYWPYYGCNQRMRMKGNERCKNKAISRDYIESVILKKIAETVFSDGMIPRLTKEYNEFLKDHNEGKSELTRAKWRLSKLKNELDKISELLIQTSSSTLFDKLNEKEEEKRELEKKIYQMELVKPISSVSEREIKVVFEKIRKKLIDGSLENIRQIIQVYVDRIEVFPDNVVIQFNYLPKVVLPLLKGGEAIRIIKESSNALQTNELSLIFTQKSVGHFGGESGLYSGEH